MSYHNTTHETGQMLMNFTNTASAQNIIILDFFRSNKHKSFTAWECWEALDKEGNKMLFTSVRRGITDLCKSLLLTNTGEKIMERHKRPNFKFKYNETE